MKKLWLALAVVVCLACCAFAVDNSQIHALRVFDKNNPPSPPCNGPCNISYNGGPVFEKTPTVYIVWYGNWTAKDKNVIDYYFAHLGKTTQMKINTKYSDSANKFVPITVKHSAANDYHDNYSQGKSCNDSCIQTVVANAISGGHLPNNQNGIYFVLTYKDVTDPDGFCSVFCGYHGPSTSIVNGEVIKYSMVGDPGQCPTGCSTPVVLGDHGKGGSPNQDPDADGTTAIMWHEFSETVSDPEVNFQTAWAGNCGESGDCCAWIFGNLKTDGNGNYYTNTIGTKHYVMQEMFELNTKARGSNEPGTCQQVYH